MGAKIVGSWMLLIAPLTRTTFPVAPTLIDAANPLTSANPLESVLPEPVPTFASKSTACALTENSMTFSEAFCHVAPALARIWT